MANDVDKKLGSSGVELDKLNRPLKILREELQRYVYDPVDMKYRQRLYNCTLCTNMVRISVKMSRSEHKFISPSIKVVLDAHYSCGDWSTPSVEYQGGHYPNSCSRGNADAEDVRCINCMYGKNQKMYKMRNNGNVSRSQTLILCSHPEVAEPGVYRTIRCTCEHFKKG